MLLRWFVTTLAMIALPYFLPGIKITSVYAALLAAAVLVLINAIIRPVIKLLTLPLNILTLGFFSIILNGVFFWFVARLIIGFSVSSFFTAMVGAFIISIINWILGHFGKHRD
jgi:putative membrane protein